MGLGCSAKTSGAVDETDFISIWKTTASTETITLPLKSGNNYNMEVDWGDSSSSTITAFDDIDITHEYAVAGEYTVRISGLCEAWCQNWGGDYSKIIEVVNLGVVGWAELNDAFEGCNNLVAFNFGNTDLSSITNFTSMFNNKIFAKH